VAKKLLRPAAVFGPDGRIPVKKTKARDFINLGPGEESVPGTNDTVPRLRPIPLGVRAVGYDETEVDALIEGLRQFRDSQPETMLPRTPARRATMAPTSPPTPRQSAAPRRAAVRR
jgi:hypothetical protein